MQFFKDGTRFINVAAVKSISTEAYGKRVVLDMLDGSKVTIVRDDDSKAILEAVKASFVTLQLH